MSVDTNTPDVFGKPPAAFIMGAWGFLFAGGLAYCISLWRADFDEFLKALLLSVLIAGLAGAVVLQKSIRDRYEGVPVTSLFVGIAWISLLASTGMLAWTLWNAPMLPSEAAVYGLGYLLAVFAAITVQKNVRDMIAFKARHPEMYGPEAIDARRQTAQRGEEGHVAPYQGSAPNGGPPVQHTGY